MEQIVQLLISMLVKYKQYGDSIGYTKEELDNFIEKYELVKLECNELGALILYDYKYITKEKFAEVMYLEFDGDFWMAFSDFEEALPSDCEFEAKVLDGRIWEDWNASDYYNYDVNFSDYSDKTLEQIIGYCDEHGCSIDVDEKEILLTKDNMRIENGNIYVGDEDLDEHTSDDGVDELIRTIQFGISDAHDSAEVDAVYIAVKDNFEDGMGEYKRVPKKNKDDEYYVYVKVEADLTEVMVALEDAYTYGGVTTYSTEQYDFGGMSQVLHELDFIKMDKPNYNYLSSYPKNDDIDDYVRERLYD